MIEIIKKSEKFLKLNLKKLSLLYRKWYYLHSKYVARASLDINPKIDRNIISIAGWFHDIAKIKSDREHAKRSAKIAEKFLKGKIENIKLKIILDCIENHGTKDKPKTKEGKIFQSADKLAIFYPELRKFIKKNLGDKKLKEMLKEHYSKIKLKKAKIIARRLLNDNK